MGSAALIGISESECRPDICVRKAGTDHSAGQAEPRVRLMLPAVAGAINLWDAAQPAPARPYSKPSCSRASGSTALVSVTELLFSKGSVTPLGGATVAVLVREPDAPAEMLHCAV